MHDGDSSGPLVTTLCNAALPSPIFSTGNKLTLHSWAENANSYQSYDIIYTTTDAGTVFSRSSAQILPLHPINTRATRCREITTCARARTRWFTMPRRHLGDTRSWNVALYFRAAAQIRLRSRNAFASNVRHIIATARRIEQRPA